MKNSERIIDFVGKRKIFFSISIAILVIGIVCNIIFGTKLDIQFSGGAMIKFSYTGEVDVNELQDLIQKETEDQVSFSSAEDLMNSTEAKKAYALSVQFSGNDAIEKELQSSLVGKLKEKYPDNEFKVAESSSVDASMGFMFLMKSFVAIAIASILMVLYVAFRFKKIGGFSAGFTAVLALLHDVVVIYFLYVILKMPLDANFIAVVLMIIGYSLNDTIVIYDRVRETRTLMGPKASYSEVFNISMTKVLRRSIFTSLTTLIATAAVFVVATFYNIDSVTGFALPMMVGLISGCYSSIAIAGPVWVVWKEYKAKKALK